MREMPYVRRTRFPRKSQGRGMKSDICIACGSELVRDEECVCDPCALAAESFGERCPICRARPCCDPRGCEAEIRADERQEQRDRARAGEG